MRSMRQISSTPVRRETHGQVADLCKLFDCQVALRVGPLSGLVHVRGIQTCTRRRGRAGRLHWRCVSVPTGCECRIGTQAASETAPRAIRALLKDHAEREADSRKPQAKRGGRCVGSPLPGLFSPAVRCFAFVPFVWPAPALFSFLLCAWCAVVRW